MMSWTADVVHLYLIYGRHSVVVLLTSYGRRVNQEIYNGERVTQSHNRFVLCGVTDDHLIIILYHFITSAEEGGYVFTSVCLSACLSVGL